MSGNLTPAELAQELGVSESNILRWRREHSWPSMKFGRQIRFTPEHVAQIKAQHEAKPEKPEPTEVVVAGQTARSARHSSSA